MWAVGRFVIITISNTTWWVATVGFRVTIILEISTLADSFCFVRLFYFKFSMKEQEQLKYFLRLDWCLQVHKEKWQRIFRYFVKCFSNMSNFEQTNFKLLFHCVDISRWMEITYNNTNRFVFSYLIYLYVTLCVLIFQVV